MKKFTDILLLLCFSFLTMISCEDQELEIDNLSPSVSAKFINADSLQRLNTLIAAINAQIVLVEDSSAALDALIDGGDPTDYSANFESLDNQEDSLKSVKSDYNSIKAVINSGLLFIDNITGSGAENLIFEDSLSQYKLPLNVNSSISELFIEIQGIQYGATFNYERDTIFTEGKILIEANNLELTSATEFDSIYFFCDTVNCKSNEASATFFF